MISRRAFGRPFLGSLVGSLIGSAVGLGTAMTAIAAAPAEGLLRQDLQDARWPADIVRAADRYVAVYPQGPSAPVARSMLDLARQAVRALDRNVRLYPGDFHLEGSTPIVNEEVRKAALADRDAAFRVAHMIRDHENGVAFDVNRYVGWLQFAAALGNGPASYELALHYRKSDQPALAAPYELRAEELGFKAPASLDNVRK